MKSYFALFAGALIFTIACSSTKTVTKAEDTETPRAYASGLYLGPRKKVAITKFENLTRFGQRRLGDYISNVLSTELAKTGRFVLLEREAVAQILEQVKLSQAGLTEGTLEQVQLLDADFIITGAVTHYAVSTSGSSNVLAQSKIQRAEVAVEVRIINVRSGEIILAEIGKGVAEKKFGKVLGMGESGGYDESLEMDAFRAAVVKVVENIIASAK
jgi:curli biogenesis system outer membrane secretion channel CsgG